MKACNIMQHKLGDGRFDMYHDVMKHISVDTTLGMDPKTAAAEIDRCLTTMVKKSRPVYIGVPVDMAWRAIENANLDTPIAMALEADDEKAVQNVVSKIRSKLESAKHPVIVMDGGKSNQRPLGSIELTGAGAVRNRVMKPVEQLTELTQIAAFTTAMGKGCLNESAKTFDGIYAGGISQAEVKRAVENTGCCLFIGRVTVR